MPNKSLPPNPSLDHLKYQARDLLITLTQGHAEACARAREFHPELARMSDDQIRDSKPSLADAQLIIAREYGFPSWPKLKHHIEALAKAATSTMAPLSSVQAPTGPVELKPKWPLGARIVQETELKQNAEIYFPGKADPFKNEVFLTSQYAYTVAKELPSGEREVELQHLGFQLESNVEGYLRRYDSRRAEGDQSEIARLFNTIMRAKVRYFLDANNKVERLEGIDELVNRLNLYEGAKLKPDMTWDNQELDKVLSRMPPVKQPIGAIDTGLRMRFDEEYFKYLMDPFFLPDKAVQPGDTWTFFRKIQKNKLSLLTIGIRWEATVTFHSWEMRADRFCARLEFRGTEKTIPQVEPGKARKFAPIIEGAISGMVWFDPESGRAIESNMNHDFNVTYKTRAMLVPYTRSEETITDRHHQVVTTRLVSIYGTS